MKALYWGPSLEQRENQKAINLIKDLGLKKCRAIVDGVPEAIHGLEYVKMTHYEPIFRTYFLVVPGAKYERYAYHLSHHHIFPSTCTFDLVCLAKLDKAITELSKEKPKKLMDRIQLLLSQLKAYLCSFK